MGNWSSRGIQDILELEKAYILRNQLEDYQSHHSKCQDVVGCIEKTRINRLEEYYRERMMGFYAYCYFKEDL